MTPLLALDRINTFYGPVQVHFDLTLHVDADEIVCLLGGNASGKSTTMKIVLGLAKPRSGTVTFDGQEIGDLPTPAIVRRGIGSVPEARRLFPEMTVRENVMMGAYVRRDALGRGAADGGDGALADGEPAAYLHGRADDGPVAALRRPGARAHLSDQSRGRDNLHGRAKRQPRAQPPPSRVWATRRAYRT